MSSALPHQRHASTLRSAGLRVTRPRLAVMSALESSPHAQVEPVVAAARADIGRVSVQAVYDVLRVLGAAGLVRRIDLAGAAARYELRAGDNHHHAVCRSCGVTVDVDCAAGSAPCLEPAGSPAALYETRVADNHHHVVCRRCGQVQDIACVTGAAPCLEPSDVAGFVVDEAEVTFWGLCPACQHAGVA